MHRPIAPWAGLAAALWLAPLAARAAEPNLHVDVTPSAVPQEVQLVQHDFAPGETSGWHIHHGVEMAYVLTGDLQISVAGRAPIVVHPGDSFMVPRDTPHEARNIGARPASLILSYLMDKGVPAKIAVPAPPGL
ncbi:MAG TPA: cupin domain-containing protein [Caulobacteraceae bacterium]|jgi:quercetin dioxygenase-like cupin family protein